MPSKRVRAAMIAAAVSAVALSAQPSKAIIYITTGDPSFNTTAPTATFANSGWQWEGSWRGAFNATPISTHTFIAPQHVGGDAGEVFTFGGVGYTATSFTDIANTDIRIWTVDGTFPTYASIWDTTLDGTETGKTTVMIGRGTDRGAEVDFPQTNGTSRGWQWGADNHTQRWGTNIISGFADYKAAGDKKLLAIAFDQTGQPGNSGTNEAGVTGGDSGGGVFIKSGNQWKLAGFESFVDGPYSYSNGGTTFNATLFDSTSFWYNAKTFIDPNVYPAPNPSFAYPSRLSIVLSSIKPFLSPTWQIDKSDNWSNASAWNSGTVPNAVDAEASLRGVISVGRTVSLNSATTVGNLYFESPASYTINGGGNTLTMAVSSANAGMTVYSGNHMVSAPVALASSLNANVVAASSTLSLAGVVSGTGSIVNTGPGVLVLSATNTYTGSTTASKGVIVFANTSAIGSTSYVEADSGGAVGLATGSLSNGLLNNLLNAPNNNVGGLALAASEANANVDFTSSPLSGAKLNGMSVGAQTGMNYTGTITPNPAVGYRLGGTAAATLTISSQLTGANDVSIVNGGTIQLNNTGNNYTGNTNVNAGTLIASADANLGAPSAGLTFNNGGTFQPGSSFSTSRSVTVNFFGGTIDTPAGRTFTLSGNVTGNGPLTKSSAGTLVLAGSGNNLANALVESAGTINIAGTTSVAAVTQTGGSLLIGSNGYLHIPASGQAASSSSVLSSVPSIAAGGHFDIEDNALIINYGFETTHATRDAIRNLLVNGRSGAGGAPGAWNGSGGIVSTFAHNSGNGFDLAIGYADNEDLAAVRTGGSYSIFGGQAVASTTVLVQMTRGADATLDGVVDSQDVTIIGTHFNKPGSGQWCFGDFDYSGTCDSTDVTTLGTTFGKSTPTLSPAQLTAEFGSAFTAAFEAGQSSATPEPAGAVIVALGGTGWLMQRRRRGGGVGSNKPLET